MSPGLLFLLRAACSLSLLLLLATLLEPARIADALHGLNPGWLAAALVLCIVQTLASAVRWHRTAGALEVPLSRRHAVADYYLAALTNQILPGGVAGDVARAARHARTSGRTGPAVRAVLLERASGQIVLLAVTALLVIGSTTGQEIATALLDTTLPADPLRQAGATGTVSVGSFVLLAAASVAVAVGIHRVCRTEWWTRLAQDARTAMFSARNATAQIMLSLLVVGALIGTFVCAGRMLGVEVGPAELAGLAPLVLMAMLIPISIGGWGVRESAAAGLFALAGHPPETGVAVSIAYGLITLLAASPGALIPLWPAERQSRTA